MAAWLIPALKAVLPHVGTIISAATPVFTKNTKNRAGPAAADHTELLQQQITELQSAVSQNAENIKELAAQLQSTVAALEQGALIGEAKLKRVVALCVTAILLSAGALSASLLVVVTR